MQLLSIVTTATLPATITGSSVIETLSAAVVLYQMALQSLNFSVMNPQAPQTESLLAETEQTITKIEQMNLADQSDICTLRGFLYMVRIVQDPARNGQRYYLDVMQNYEKALKLNPDNQLAKQLQQKFFEGMQQQTGK